MSRRKKKRMASGDSGALSDLAFLLIIFFIVIAVFNVNKGFMLSLPQKNSTKIVNVNDIIKVQLNSDGSITSKETLLNIKELEEMVINQLESQPNLTFLLKINPNVQYQRVVSIIEVVRKLEVDNFSFSMLETEDANI